MKSSSSTVTDVLYWNFKYWSLCGIEVHPKEMLRSKRILKNVAMANLWTIVFIYYPLSLFLGLFKLKEPREVIESLAIVFTMTLDFMKGLILMLKVRNNRIIFKLCNEFETNVTDSVEKQVLEDFSKSSTRLIKLYFITFSVCITSSGISSIFNQRLLFPACFPFDLEKNSIMFNVALLYQFVGLWILAVMCLTYDTFQIVMIKSLSKYVNILRLRTLNIANSKSLEKNEEILKYSIIENRKQLIKLHQLAQKTFSIPILTQLLITAVNVVSAITILLFFRENIFQVVGVIFFILIYLLQIALPCYFGSIYKESTRELFRSIFECGWYDQSPGFRKVLLTFGEFCLKEHGFVAGGLLEVSLNTFLRIMRNTVSLMSFFSNFRNKFL